MHSCPSPSRRSSGRAAQGPGPRARSFRTRIDHPSLASPHWLSLVGQISQAVVARPPRWTPWRASPPESSTRASRSGSRHAQHSQRGRPATAPPACGRMPTRPHAPVSTHLQRQRPPHALPPRPPSVRRSPISKRFRHALRCRHLAVPPAEPFARRRADPRARPQQLGDSCRRSYGRTGVLSSGARAGRREPLDPRTGRDTRARPRARLRLPARSEIVATRCVGAASLESEVASRRDPSPTPRQ